MAEIYKPKEYDRNEWCTPAPWIALVKQALGGMIDLDPTSSEAAQQTVGATRYFTKENSCLVNPWQTAAGGAVTVFMNPPYGAQVMKAMIDCFIKHWLQRHISAGVVLVNNSTETAWCQKLLWHASAACFPSSRIQFTHPDPEAPKNNCNRQGQIFLYFTQTKTFSDQFYNALPFILAFKDFGICMPLESKRFWQERAETTQKMRSTHGESENKGK